MTHARVLRGCFFASSRSASPRSQAGRKVRWFTAAGDLIRVLAYVSACLRLPLTLCPCVSVHGQKPEGGLSDGTYVATGAGGIHG